jgi:hypothetical protein
MSGALRLTNEYSVGCRKIPLSRGECSGSPCGQGIAARSLWFPTFGGSSAEFLAWSILTPGRVHLRKGVEHDSLRFERKGIDRHLTTAEM